MSGYPIPKPTRKSKRANNKAKAKGDGRKAQQRRVLTKLYLNFVRPAFMFGLAAGQKRRGKAALCERCHYRLASQLHHTAGRTGEALVDSEYFAGLCQPCHDWVHDNPAEARGEGWLESKYSRTPEARRLAGELAEGVEDALGHEAAATGPYGKEGEDDVAE